jgi:hypothetical protein
MNQKLALHATFAEIVETAANVRGVYRRLVR